MTNRGWEFWIDRGGTFTDVVARAPSGELKTLKLLSVDPGRYDDAAVAGIERVLDAAPERERTISAVKMGTTVATNALLERRGEPTVLVITAGFEDVIRIGGQQRPDIFALDIRLPEMLYTRVVGAAERVDAHGRVLQTLDTAKLREDLTAARSEGLDSVAIVLLHAHRYPQHEIAAAEVARSIGFGQVSVSHRGAAATEARRARRYDVGRCLLVARPRPLCRKRSPRARRELASAITARRHPWRRPRTAARGCTSCKATAASRRRNTFAAKTACYPDRPAA